MSSHIVGILSNTKNNILRNRWLSIATVIVTFIVVLTASGSIILSLVAHRAVKVAETKAQLQIYFHLDAPEEEILKVKEKVEQYEGTEKTRYITKEEALSLYFSYYSGDQDLVDNVSSDWLPPSIEVRAESLEKLDGLTAIVKEEEEKNPYIEDVQYHEDIVKQLKTISKIITTASFIVIIVFSTITFSLIFITISFNIRAHKNEIEIMHLVGSSDAYIKLPFIFEGGIYTAIGSLFASALILLPWWAFVNHGQDLNFHFIITDLLKELNLKYLLETPLSFIVGFVLIHFFVGFVAGFLSGSVAVVRHLDLSEK